MERVACYIRVSTEEQKLHGISLDAQTDKLSEYAERHNLTIVAWYKDEGVSGRKLIRKRPELQRMLNDARAKKFDRILFIKLDRFFRSVAEYHECMKLIDPVVWTATEEKYDLTTANGRAFVNMKLTIAELEADQTGERIKLVNEFKVKSGAPLTGARCQGLAYTIINANGEKKVVPDPETKDMVADMLNHFITYQNKSSLIRYVYDKYGYSCTNSVNTLLKDTKLYGYYRGNENYCEPYIDKATFDRIQDILKNNSLKKAASGLTYIFSYTIKCPLCNHKMICCSNKKINKYYRCNESALYKKCSYNKYIPEPMLENELLASFEDYVRGYCISHGSVMDNHDANQNITEKRINEIRLEMKNATTAFLKGRIPEPEYDRLYNELELELKELEKQTQPIEARDLTIYEDLLKSDWKEMYRALTEVNKRAFWRKYIKEIHITEDRKIKEIIFL